MNETHGYFEDMGDALARLTTHCYWFCFYLFHKREFGVGGGG